MTYSSEVLADAPFAYYRLDEAPGSTTAADSSGNGRTLSHAAGSVVFGSAGLITEGTSASLDGGDELTISPATIATTATTSLSLEAWVRTTTAAARIACGWARGVDITVVRFALRQTSTGLPQATLNTSGGTFTITGTTVINDGTRHHLAVVLDAGVTLTLYVDGAPEATASVTSGSTDLNRVRVGGSGSSSTRWNGDLDEVAFYTSALPSARVAAHYEAGTGTATPTVSATFSGAGSLSAAVSAVYTTSADFSGSGALSAVAFDASEPFPTVVTTAAFSGAGSLTADAFGVLAPQPSGTALTREGGRSRSGQAVATWEPPVVMPPTSGALLEHRRIRATAFGNPTSDFPVTYTTSEATAPRHRTRIMVGGKDVSFYRGVPTPEPEYQLAEPLRWGPSSVEFPQIAAAFFNPADYPWLAKGKPVTYQRVDAAGNKLAIDYRGVVVAYDTSGKTLRLEVGGHAQGRAALRHKPLPIFKDTLDLGRLAWAAVRDLGLAFSPRLGPTTGIKQALFGGSDHLTHISELCAKAYDFDGQWSLMPDDSGRYTFARKDATTAHWRLFNDDAHVVADLRSDAAEEPNRIFATGVTPKGQRVRFGVYPGLKPGPAAPYPFTDDRTFGQWTTDAETDAGDGITVMLRKLWTAGFLSLEEMPGEYDADVTRAIMALQDEAGLPVTGNVNPPTWAALFDLDATGYNLRGSRIEPAAQDYRVRRYNRSSSGAIIGKNPNFDPNRLVVDREIDFSSGFTRHQMRDLSRAEIYRGEDNWFGTITIHGGAVLRGDIAPGATITEADLADVRDISPGENVGLPLFGGGILLHISGVEITRGQDGHPIAKLVVDTQARDALPVQEMIRRNRETRRDPARRWKGNRASGIVKDSITPSDEMMGLLPGDRVLESGWNIFPTVAGQEGTVSNIRLRVSAEAGVVGDPVEFACAVFGRQITAARLNTLVPAPLGDNGDTPWWEEAPALEKKMIRYASGTKDEPCGYRGPKTRGAPLLGIHADEAGFSYRTDRQPVLYLAVYVRSAAVLEGGRVMWAQLEAGA